MLLVQRKTNIEGFYTTEIIDFDSNWIEKAKKEFIYFKEKGVILNNSFDDLTWKLTNEVENLSLKFDFSEVLFQKQISKNKREMMDFEEFVYCIKAYFVFKLNSQNIGTIQHTLNILRDVMEKTEYFNPKKVNKISESLNSKTHSSTSFVSILELIDFLPINDIDDFKDEWDYQYEHNLEVNLSKRKQNKLQRRSLAEFQSYFYFDRLIKDFWKHHVSDEEKLYYYPLYLWWIITNILPLRPREFCLIPYDCLKPGKNGEFILTIRRSNLKGQKREKKITTHTIDGDYSLYHYHVSFEVASIIKDYQNLVKRYGESKFLISYEAYLSILPAWNQGAAKAKRGKTPIFTRGSLTHILNNFYVNVLQKKYGLQIVYKNLSFLSKDKIKIEDLETYLKKSEIMKINLGDTRHMAIINMTMSDVNPILIRDFAGHEDINTTFHYFGHMDQLVKCISYYKYQELRSINVDEAQLWFEKPNEDEKIRIKFKMKTKGKFIEVDRGKCYSDKFFVGDITHCKEANNGDCESCDFFEGDPTKYREKLEEMKAELENGLQEDGFYFGNILKGYKKTLNEDGELIRTHLNIQQKAQAYLKIEKKLILEQVNG
ncbi:hypothetical protein SAMN05444673_4430 [Bacillus sp. OV166]|uniref:hypothetical protein n=1 Tax=Bacillus sp. OV166 TaxID=1882763 RepID=UPI000A2ADB1C|nr:hypothetical protein [Bacillus sp. OV166]SMQ81651.1 hypothetical protein SAMN05444673_4430 [Bacillus sp. OV166]